MLLTWWIKTIPPCCFQEQYRDAPSVNIELTNDITHRTNDLLLSDYIKDQFNLQ